MVDLGARAADYNTLVYGLTWASGTWHMDNDDSTLLIMPGQIVVIIW